jgi:hypothetical protein
MSEENLFETYTKMISAIQLCINQSLGIPALVLIYAFIDSVSWMDNSTDNERNAGKRFQKWVNDWMLKDKKMSCTAEELYAARCGVLHTLTPDSSLSKNKGIRQIGYAFGKANLKSVEENARVRGVDRNFAFIHLRDLFESFKLGLVNYLDQTLKDEKKAERFKKKAEQHFPNIDISTMNDFLERSKKEELQKLTDEEIKIVEEEEAK